MVEHTKYIQVNRYYYRCEITRQLYFIVKRHDKTIKFKCASRLNNKNISTKYIADIEFTC